MDYGPHFGEITKSRATSKGIVWCNSPVAAKKPTGLIEKTVDLLQRVLKKKSIDHRKWPEYVQDSVFEVNKREMTHLLHSPSEIFLVFGLTASLETKFPAQKRQALFAMFKIGDHAISQNDDEHCCKVIDFILCRTLTRRKHDLGVRANYKFKPGDMVMLYDHRESGKKLRSTWRGPFIITSFGEDMGKSYTLRQISGKPLPRHYHGDSLKPFRLREENIVTNEEVEFPVFQNIRFARSIYQRFHKISSIGSNFIVNDNGENRTAWGSIKIFDGTNFPQFEASIKDILEIAGVWAIVTGEELKPKAPSKEDKVVNDRITDWIARNERATIIIASSVSSVFHTESFRKSVTARDATALWKEVAKLNSNSEGIFATVIRAKFYTNKFNSETTKITEYYAELASIRKTLLGSDRQISELEILDRILLSIQDLPIEKNNWHNARFHIIYNRLDLLSPIQILREAETLSPTPRQSAKIAGNQNHSSDNIRGRGNPRGRRRGSANRGRVNFRGRIRGRGPNLQNNRDRSSGVSGNHGLNFNGNNNNVGRGNCGFCLRSGHWQKDCSVYQMVRSQYLETRSNSNSRDHANVITENQYNRDDYLCPDEQAAVVVETALMSTYINKLSWKIDSGATRHFSGKLGDFSGLKRWSSPKYVLTADGNTCPSDGYGTCKIGELTLKHVWYVPAFKDIRLISVGALNRDNISVVFEDCVATARTKGIVLFEAPLCDNLYQLVDKPRKSESHIQHSLSAHQSSSTAQSPLSIDEMSRVPSNDAELWHFRLAHVSYKTISRLPNMPQKPKVISKGENACEACLAGKMKETFSKKTDNRTSRPARRLHADISG
ncbi:hypothetical protein K3495_g10345 [Podosphaera aphanis]|nr:hypothetical protein K3495_g10345 [Podosphaera aphanis]